LSVTITNPVFGAGTLADPQTVIGAGQVITGGVLSILVLYVTAVALPQPSVVVTVITALHVPTVLATSVNAPGQLSVALVAAKAAASAAATVG
jgi:hypothetical protein